MMLKGVLLLGVMLAPLPAQWIKLPQKGIPRTKDGAPDLAAPAPRKPYGKPDLSGIWVADPPKLRDYSAGLKPEEFPIQPWAQALYNGKHPVNTSDCSDAKMVHGGGDGDS